MLSDFQRLINYYYKLISTVPKIEWTPHSSPNIARNFFKPLQQQTLRPSSLLELSARHWIIRARLTINNKTCTPTNFKRDYFSWQTDGTALDCPESIHHKWSKSSIFARNSANTNAGYIRRVISGSARRRNRSKPRMAANYVMSAFLVPGTDRSRNAKMRPGTVRSPEFSMRLRLSLMVVSVPQLKLLLGRLVARE